MLRFSDDYILVRRDLEDGLIKRRSFKGLVEYWIYRGKESNIFLPDGSKAKATGTPNYLHAVIVCEPNHVTSETVKSILVKGAKFTEGDLEDYLKKTERGTNG